MRDSWELFNKDFKNLTTLFEVFGLSFSTYYFFPDSLKKILIGTFYVCIAIFKIPFKSSPLQGSSACGTHFRSYLP